MSALSHGEFLEALRKACEARSIDCDRLELCRDMRDAPSGIRTAFGPEYASFAIIMWSGSLWVASVITDQLLEQASALAVSVICDDLWKEIDKQRQRIAA